MAKRISQYATMTASDLARVTRERGLTKPEGMINISEWADWLEALDAKEAAPVQASAQVIESEAADEGTFYGSYTKSELLELADSESEGDDGDTFG